MTRGPLGTASVAATGRYRPYPVYKNSGVEWLREIPAHWDVKRLKHVATWNDEVLPDWTGSNLELTYVDIGGVDARDGIVGKEHLTFGAAPSRARRIVRDGDVIISTVRTYLQAIASIVMPEPNLIVSTGFAVIRPRNIDGSFAAYAVRAPYFVDNVVANSAGVSYSAISADELALLPVACPTDGEQRAIAAFLDRETAKLDALVAKKERLIELVQEKRSALVTRSVTKGLDANVPMKNSGVEWMGNIPAHWETKKVTWLFSVGSGTTPPTNHAEYYGREVPWLTTSELRESIVTATDRSVTIEALHKFPALNIYPEGSIVIAMYGATIGRLGILGMSATVNQARCVFSKPNSIDPRLFYYWLQARRPYLISLGYGGGQPNLSQELLKSIRMPISNVDLITYEPHVPGSTPAREPNSGH